MVWTDKIGLSANINSYLTNLSILESNNMNRIEQGYLVGKITYSESLVRITLFFKARYTPLPLVGDAPGVDWLQTVYVIPVLYKFSGHLSLDQVWTKFKLRAEQNSLSPFKWEVLGSNPSGSLLPQLSLVRAP